MSLRLQMLQVARRGALSLGESLPAVRDFARSRISPSGAGMDRDNRPDLYYTIFAIALLQSLDEPVPNDLVREELRSYGMGDSLDFIHLGALARCWSAVGDYPDEFATGMLKNIECYRTADGGYDGQRGAAGGTAYGGFVALGAYQDLKVPLPDPLRLVQSLKFLETSDGGWGNAPGLKEGSTNPSAAAVTLLHQLEMPVNEQAGHWLLEQMHPAGGFLAMPMAPIPDLLSTATALHALACLNVELSSRAKEQCLDFLDSLWTGAGGFHGHWADDHLDAEYTFYGLLALGHLI